MRENCPAACGFCPLDKKPETTHVGGTCEDLRVDCAELAKRRYCLTAQNFAKTYCAKSCGFCFAPPVTEMPDHKAGLGVPQAKSSTPLPRVGPTLVTTKPMVTFWPKPR